MSAEIDSDIDRSTQPETASTLETSISPNPAPLHPSPGRSKSWDIDWRKLPHLPTSWSTSSWRVPQNPRTSIRSIIDITLSCAMSTAAPDRLRSPGRIGVPHRVVKGRRLNMSRDAKLTKFFVAGDTPDKFRGRHVELIKGMLAGRSCQYRPPFAFNRVDEPVIAVIGSARTPFEQTRRIRPIEPVRLICRPRPRIFPVCGLKTAPQPYQVVGVTSSRCINNCRLGNYTTSKDLNQFFVILGQFNRKFRLDIQPVRLLSNSFDSDHIRQPLDPWFEAIQQNAPPMLISLMAGARRPVLENADTVRLTAETAALNRSLKK